MAKAADVAMCAFGLAAAVAWLGASSAFVVGRQVSTAPPRAAQLGFLGSAESSGAKVPSSSFSQLCSGAGIAVAGLVVAAGVHRAAAGAAVARRAIVKAKDVTFAVVPGQEDEPFVGGLVGTEYHGWGSYEFDPMRLSDTWPEHVPWYREAELKHGRVAMLGCLGLLVPDVIRIPGDAFVDPNLDMLTAHNRLIGPGLGEGPMWWLLAFCGVVESLRFKQLGLDFGELSLENAGDLGFGKSFFPKTKEGQIQMQIKELKNGRLAMLAFSGAITQGIAWECHHFPFVPQ